MTDDLARTDAPELLPCPFCGGEAHIDGTSWTTRDGKDQAWATCRKCGTYGPSSTDAVAAWNRRAPTALAASPEVQALLREARVQVIEEVTKLPNRIEPIGGQNHRYVRIEEILLLDPATIVAQVDAGQATGAWRDIATAPERIWVDIDENPRGALIGTVFATDLGDVPYILATPTAIAASPEMQALLREARAQGMEEAADWHDSEIAGLERRIEANNEYLARRHGEAGTHYHCSEANEACQSGIITHRTAASTIRTAAAALRAGKGETP